MIGEAVARAERLARSAACGEIRIAESTWRLVRHAAHASELPGGGFLLQDLDDDAPAIVRSLDRPLIGRDEEVGRLREAFASIVAQSSPELITILGEPGIGKSRLVAELTAIAGERGMVLTGRCPAYGEGITYWPLREIVLQALNATGDRSVDELAATLGIPPSVAHRVAGSVGLEEGEAGEETGWAFQQLIVALARVRPLIIVVDDVHWAEPALVDLLLDVAARLRKRARAPRPGDAPRPVRGPAPLGAPHREGGRPEARAALRHGQQGSARGDLWRPPRHRRGTTDRRHSRRQPPLP